MKKYCNSVFVIIILLVTAGCSKADHKNVIHYVSQGGLSATIKIPGLKDTLKLKQITDAHISIADESEAEFMKYGERMHKAYMYPRKHYSRDTSETTFQYLDDILLKAKKENIDLLLLTGDIVNFPSAVSVNYVYDRLTKTGIPWLFISGNHDWDYEGMVGNRDSLHITWLEKSLGPLFNGHNPLYFSEIIKGINFVGIDNSTFKVSNEQVKFLEDQLSGNEPIIMICHIPFSLIGDASQPGSTAIVDLILSNSDKIIAIISGHVHRSSYYFTGNLCQYTSLPAFQGAAMSINIMPE